jgi:Chalcone isomerase-like
MKKNIIIILILGCLTAQSQITVSGVTMPRKVMIGPSQLTLNGAGIREKLWIDLYVAGLYVKAKTNDAKSIINDDNPTAIKLHIVSSLITSKKMLDAVDEGFQKSTNKNTSPIKLEIEAFKVAFKEEIKVDDVYDIVYVPSKGTIILKNGKLSGTIKGLAFKKALFGIWIGDDPADKNLKKSLLGKK